MNWGADYSQAVVTTEILPANCERWMIAPEGFLLAVCISGRKSRPWGTDVQWRAEFDIESPDGTALYERIKWEYQMVSCGVAFTEPLPNMNTATPYVLRKIHPAETPELTLTLVHLIMKEST